MEAIMDAEPRSIQETTELCYGTAPQWKVKPGISNKRIELRLDLRNWVDWNEVPMSVLNRWKDVWIIVLNAVLGFITLWFRSTPTESGKSHKLAVLRMKRAFSTNANSWDSRVTYSPCKSVQKQTLPEPSSVNWVRSIGQCNLAKSGKSCSD